MLFINNFLKESRFSTIIGKPNGQTLSGNIGYNGLILFIFSVFYQCLSAYISVIEFLKNYFIDFDADKRRFIMIKKIYKETNPELTLINFYP